MAIEGTGMATGQVVPHLMVRGVAQAIQFYKRALGAVELFRSPMPGMPGIGAQLRVGAGLVLLSDEIPEAGKQVPGFGSPQSLGGAGVTVQIYVDDVDSYYQRAVDAGATPLMPPEDTFWADKFSMVKDPFGHVWAIVTVKEELSPREVGDRMREFVSQGHQGD